MDRSKSVAAGRRGASTLVDIAGRSGVSRSTVSLVMRGSSLVADATRDKVLQAAEELGYVYNRAASNLRTARTGSVGLLITTIGNPYFSEFIAGVETELSSTGQVVFFAQHSEDLAVQDRMLRRFLENRVDGIILAAAEGTTTESVERLSAMGTAVVLTLRRVACSTASYVGSDNVAGAAATAKHLLTVHAPRSLAFVGSGPGGSSQRERTEGMLRAVDDAGFPRKRVQIVPTQVTTREAAYEATRKLLATAPPFPVGVVAYNDVVAFGVAGATRDAGLTVGKDVLLVGFDDIEAARFEQTPLTTVSAMPTEIGRLAGRTLLGMLQDATEPTEIVHPNTLIIRASCGCPR